MTHFITYPNLPQRMLKARDGLMAHFWPLKPESFARFGAECHHMQLSCGPARSAPPLKESLCQLKKFRVPERNTSEGE